jgi:hypothetical protein
MIPLNVLAPIALLAVVISPFILGPLAFKLLGAVFVAIVILTLVSNIVVLIKMRYLRRPKG